MSFAVALNMYPVDVTGTVNDATPLEFVVA